MVPLHFIYSAEFFFIAFGIGILMGGVADLVRARRGE
jgi:hypothetical protein